jgi:3-hydroxybutyryl-CoA dehydrogenase
MGHGIGLEFARVGYEVVLQARTEKTLQQAQEKIQHKLGEMAEWGLVSPGEIPSIIKRIRTTTSLEEAAADADLVVEAVIEVLERKQEVLRDLDDICPERTVLASTTSGLMPTSLASATQRPDRVVVAHFSYPPHLIPLVEIVRGERTSDETVQVIYDVVKSAGKHPIILQKEATGFVMNRMQFALIHEALSIVDQGIASAQDVDIAVKESFGRRFGVAGPLEMVEIMDGWDALLRAMKYMLPELDRSSEPPQLLEEMVQQGKLGAKWGADGFYEWTPESTATWSRRLESYLAGFLRSDDTPG